MLKEGSPADRRLSALFPGDRPLVPPAGPGPEYLCQHSQEPAQGRPAPCCRRLRGGQQPGLNHYAGCWHLGLEFPGMDLIERAPGRLGLWPVQFRLAAPADRDLMPAPGQHCGGGLAATAAAPLGQASGLLQLRSVGALFIGISHETSPPVTGASTSAFPRISWCVRGYVSCNPCIKPCLPEHQQVCLGLPGL